METRNKEQEKRLLFFYGNTIKPSGSLGARTRARSAASEASVAEREVRAPRLPLSVILTVFCTFKYLEILLIKQIIKYHG
jgi:hypothetical protein